jgi:hypothetical protein
MKPISVTSSRAPLHKAFALIPYPAENIPVIEITGTVTRQANRLSIHYSVRGELENIVLPEPSKSSRQDDLWRATCFEFFIAPQDQSQYWEFNLSPSSKWNVYAMDAYRQVNMREEIAFTQLPFEFRKTNEELLLDISVNLNPILESETALEVGVTTIIQTTDATESYWALVHPGSHADFHLRESFIMSF